MITGCVSELIGRVTLTIALIAKRFEEKEEGKGKERKRERSKMSRI